MPEKKTSAAAPSRSGTKAENSAVPKTAVKSGIEHITTPNSKTTASPKKKGKLAPKNKQRLPRREKKALQKAAASHIQ
jgi:hypothetical protein